jgi:hypothetical protein
MTKKNNNVTMLLYEIWQRFTCVSRKGAAAIYRVPPIRGLIYTGSGDPPSLLYNVYRVTARGKLAGVWR